jgi:hypothetical protein
VQAFHNMIVSRKLMRFFNFTVLVLLSFLLTVELAHAAPAGDLTTQGRAAFISRTGHDLNLGTNSTNNVVVRQNNVTTFSINGTTGAISASGALSLASLAVTGNATIGGTLGVTGNATIGGTLGVTGIASFTDRVRFSGGTNALPSLSFTSEPDTGFNLRSTDAIDVATGGLGRWYWTGGDYKADAANGGAFYMPRTFNVVDTGVILGTTGRVSDIQAATILSIADNNTVINSVFQESITDASGPLVYFQKTRKTDHTADTIVNSADILGQISFRGADGAAFQSGAVIVSKVDGTPGSGDMPGSLDFQTTPDGSSTPASVLKLSNDKSSLFTGTVRSSATADIGWSVVNAANQACNTTCTSACVVGIDTLGTGGFLGCAVATADSCLCAGAS